MFGNLLGRVFAHEPLEQAIGGAVIAVAEIQAAADHHSTRANEIDDKIVELQALIEDLKEARSYHLSECKRGRVMVEKLRAHLQG